MKKLIFIALIAYGFWNWKTHHQAVNVDAFDESGNPIALVYTLAQCGEGCDLAISDLRNRKIPHKVIEVDMNDTESDAYKSWKKIGINGFPIIQIGEDRVVGYMPSQLKGMISKNFSTDSLTAKERFYYAKHFDSKGNAKVVLYGTNWCGYCKKLRQDLQSAGIAYLDIDVEPGGSLNKDLAETMEIGGYPTVYVGYKRISNATDVSNIKAAL